MKLKICGIRRPEDVAFLNKFPPDYAGFIFAESRRRVTPKEAASLISLLNPAVIPVGVFVNEPLESLLDIAAHAALGVLQLHGDEDASYLFALRARTPLPIWKAVRVKNAETLCMADDFPADLLLLDAFSSRAYGGTGTPADWNLIQHAPPRKPFFLAGGLHAGNLAEAVRRTHPAGVDLSGGVETDGIKDLEKIRAVTNLMRTFP